MVTEEGVDEMEVVVSACRGGWQMEAPATQKVSSMVVHDKCQAVILARRLFPDAQIRILLTDDTTRPS